MSQMRVWANPAQTIGVPFAKTFITPIGNTSPLASRMTDSVGSTAWDELCPHPNTPYIVTIDAPGFEHFEQRFENIFQDLDIPLTPTGVPLSRLVGIDHHAHRMVNERGERVYGRGAGFFLGYKRWLDGVDLGPQLRQLRGLGCNLVRIMGMFESLGGFNPKVYGDRYYDDLPLFMRDLAQHGLHGLWTACAATGGMMNPDEALRHTQRIAERLLTTNNALFSYVNEQGQHNNSVDRARFKANVNTGWMIYDTGSFGVDLPVEPPFGMYAPFHVRRDYPSSVKDCGIIDHTNRVNNGLEIGVDEPYRMGDEGSGDRHDDPTVAREAAGIAYNALYFVVHTMQGERADLLTGNTLDCASAAFDAMKGH